MTVLESVTQYRYYRCKINQQEKIHIGQSFDIIQIYAFCIN